MREKRIRKLFLYAGLGRKEYSTISTMIWSGNLKTLRITSCLAAGIGVVYLILNLYTQSRPGYWTPYAFLIAGSLMITVLRLLILRSSKQSAVLSMVACYGQILLIFIYSCILSSHAVNYDLPAVSAIVFISILPLSIDDRPIRMILFILLESVVYLFVSYLFKSPRAFGFDVEDVVAFSIVGMVLYIVMCTRNIRELYQGMRIEKIQKSIISSLATVVEERDEDTGGHIMRCEDYVERLLKQMRGKSRYSYLTSDYCNNIVLAAAMHDIGKIKIPDQILNKPGKLTEAEYEIMKMHSEFGAEIIQKTMSEIEEEEFCKIAFNIAKYHHERYDGTGYPTGLKGEDIPLEARVMALADVYDALISPRVYKKAFSKEKARAIILEGSGTQFDPALVPLFLECV